MNKTLALQTLTIGLVVLVLLILIKVFGIAFPVTVTTSYKSSELAVSGEGKVDVVPDSANVDVGISVSNAKTVEDAQNQINTVNNAIVASMQKLGIDKKNIKTSNYSIYPNYDYETGRTITGYGADVYVTITTKNTQQVAQIVSEATKAGANTVSGTSFTVSDPGKYRADARKKAIENAKQQAEEIAKSLGITLGKVVNIVESNSGETPNPIYMERALGGAAQSAVPDFQEGSQTISSVVTLYFEKK